MSLTRSDRNDKADKQNNTQGQDEPAQRSGDHGQPSKQRRDRDGPDRQRSKGMHRPADFDLIEKGVIQLAALTGREPESVSGITPMEEGWQLTVEVIELERVPPSTNITATYEAELDEQGNLVGYRRSGRYYRNQPLEE
jgi:Gas vesicle synthesis protein GvpO